MTDPYGATPPPVTTDDSLGSIVGRLTADVSTLVRQEIALARAEVTQDVKHASKGAGMFAGAGVAGHFVLMFLSIAAWWGLGYLIGNAWSAVVVAVVWAIVALVLYTVGKKQLAAADGIPQTAETVSKIPNALKGHQETS
ncbi:phage holin family protein [Miniimonas sp. S16]|uniref:phage holin family protein n=1 Tax=Miniimonas sp. S16 TaxID=2171623 RepID=UPI000D528EC5|nr:phage holin family protein [Miniimonas sp. S16]